MWSAVMSLPNLPYNSAAQHTYEGLVPGSRTTRGLAAVTRTPPPPPGGHDRQLRQRRRSRRGPQPCLELQAGNGGAACCGVPRILGTCVYACVCVCSIFRMLRFKVLV